MTFWTLLLFGSAGVAIYPYFLYPAILWLWSRGRRRSPAPSVERWPSISITVPAHNEESAIRSTIERLLDLEYPGDRRQVLVVSDASTDRTDAIVTEFADRGVQLLRVARRGGKTAAENAARALLTGEIVVNTDASVRIHRQALRPLIAAFADPTVGVASGRDVSVSTAGEEANAGEGGYVGYEMWVRDLETRISGIVGASGCFYAIRSDLHQALVPDALSRDFAAALIAREHGYRAISVNEAVCFVPRVVALHREYRRKVRTMTRGLETLFYKRELLDPFHHGVFAWMLWSHKLIRWLVPWTAAAATLSILVLAGTAWWARIAAAAVATVAVLALAGWWWPPSKPVPRLVAVPAYTLSGLIAGMHAWINAIRGEQNPVWEPTKRELVDTH